MLEYVIFLRFYRGPISSQNVFDCCWRYFQHKLRYCNWSYWNISIWKCCKYLYKKCSKIAIKLEHHSLCDFSVQLSSPMIVLWYLWVVVTIYSLFPWSLTAAIFFWADYKSYNLFLKKHFQVDNFIYINTLKQHFKTFFELIGPP